MSQGFDSTEEPALAWRGTSGPSDHFFLERWRHTPSGRKWAAMLLTALLSGPFAVLAALWQNSSAGFPSLLLVVVLAPVIEETVKIVGVAYVAEQRPWLVPRGLALPFVALASGLTFAAMENVWYLQVLIPDPPRELVVWRWIFGPLVHGAGSLTAGFGVSVMWHRAMASGRRPSFADAQPWLVAAAVWHGLYNAFAVLLEWRG